MKHIFRLLLTALFFNTPSYPLFAQWVETNIPYGSYIGCFAVSPNGSGGTNLFAGTMGNGIFLSTNNGTSWTEVNTGLTNTDIRSLATSPNGAGGTNLFAGTAGGIFLSTNNGTSWTEVNSGLTNTYIRSLATSPNGADGTSLFAGTFSSGVFLSTNNGTNWTEVNSGLTKTNVSSFDVSPNGTGGNNIFAGTLEGVFLSTNNGTSWTEVNTGLTHFQVQSLAISGTNLFAGIYGGGVWRRPLSEFITSVELLSNAQPSHFRLEQNYPNPINPSTEIIYTITKAGNVTLKVYNMLGQEIVTLVNGYQAANSYEVNFNASGLSSGVYYYRLQAGVFSETKKLVLLR